MINKEEQFLVNLTVSSPPYNKKAKKPVTDLHSTDFRQGGADSCPPYNKTAKNPVTDLNSTDDRQGGTISSPSNNKQSITPFFLNSEINK